MTDAERIARLSPEKRALLLRRLRDRAGSAEDAARIPRRTTRGPVEMSFAQQRLWFLDQLSPANPFYNADNAVRLPFAVDPAAMARAVSEIVLRHEALRTRFDVIDGRPMQIVDPPRSVPVEVTDLSRLAAGDRHAEAMRLATLEGRAPFDLRTGPLLRARLLRLAPDDWILALTLHHIVCDGWSLGVLFGELGALYEAVRAAPAVTAAGLPDPVRRLRALAARLAAGRAPRVPARATGGGGSQRLAPLELPTDRPRPPVQRFRGGTVPLHDPRRPQRGRCADVSRAEGATPVHDPARRVRGAAGTAHAPGRHRGRRADRRPRPRGARAPDRVLRQLAGPPHGLRGRPELPELLQRVRETCARRARPSGPAVRDGSSRTLQPARDLSRNPLFQVTFQSFNSPTLVRRADGGALDALEVQRGTSKFDITFDLWQTADGTAGQWTYDADLFDRDTVERMAAQYGRLLRSAVSDPSTPLTRLELLNGAERQQLVHDLTRPIARIPATARWRSSSPGRRRARPARPRSSTGSGRSPTESCRHARESSPRASSRAAALPARWWRSACRAAPTS